MKYLLTSVTLLLICTSLISQTLPSDAVYKANAEKQGSMMATLLLKKDYKKFTAFTYAPVIKMMGGGR